MNRTQRKIQRARRLGVFVMRWPGHKRWDIYVESEGPLGPRYLQWSKRRAANLAHQITMYRRAKVVITTN